MFSDTHCHLSHIEERGEDLSALLAEISGRGFSFVLDIGTKPGDFEMRLEKIRKTGGIPSFLHFSCGLWPDSGVIAGRKDALRFLETDIVKMLDLARSRAARGKTSAFAALGECGLDRYWNRAENAELKGEEELFGEQLDLARKNDLAVIVHSREAFTDTLGCIKNALWDKGVIHCYSYGIKEARAFLDRGWYISFPGNITWAKKEADLERIAELLRYIPRERLLLETDAPYLAPAPHRGKTNTPLLIEHIYEYAALVSGINISELADLVYENAKNLFKVGQ